VHLVFQAPDLRRFRVPQPNNQLFTRDAGGGSGDESAVVRFDGPKAPAK
jgi:hypothetical protein